MQSCDERYPIICNRGILKRAHSEVSISLLGPGVWVAPSNASCNLVKGSPRLSGLSNAVHDSLQRFGYKLFLVGAAAAARGPRAHHPALKTLKP